MTVWVYKDCSLGLFVMRGWFNVLGKSGLVMLGLG